MLKIGPVAVIGITRRINDLDLDLEALSPEV